MALPRGGAQAGRRHAGRHVRFAAAGSADRSAHPAGERATRPVRVLGLGARPGGRRRQQRDTGAQRAQRPAGALALAPDLSAHPRAQYRLHRVRGADLRSRPPRRPWHRHSGQGAHRRERVDAGMDFRPAAGRAAAAAGGPAGLFSLGVPHRGGRRFRIAGGAPAAAGGTAPTRAPPVRDRRSRFRAAAGLSGQCHARGAGRAAGDAAEKYAGHHAALARQHAPSVPGQARRDRQRPRRGGRASARRRSAAGAAALRRLLPRASHRRGHRSHQRHLARPAQPRPAPAQRRSLRHARDPGTSGGAHGVGLGAGRRAAARQPAHAPAADEHDGREPPPGAPLHAVE